MLERHVGGHLEGIPFYRSRGEFPGPDTSRFAGTKRSNSDSFMVSSKEKFPQVRPESLESSHLMKVRSVSFMACYFRIGKGMRSYAGLNLIPEVHVLKILDSTKQYNLQDISFFFFLLIQSSAV